MGLVGVAPGLVGVTPGFVGVTPGLVGVMLGLWEWPFFRIQSRPQKGSLHLYLSKLDYGARKQVAGTVNVGRWRPCWPHCATRREAAVLCAPSCANGAPRDGAAYPRVVPPVRMYGVVWPRGRRASCPSCMPLPCEWEGWGQGSCALVRPSLAYRVVWLNGEGKGQVMGCPSCPFPRTGVARLRGKEVPGRHALVHPFPREWGGAGGVGERGREGWHGQGGRSGGGADVERWGGLLSPAPFPRERGREGMGVAWPVPRVHGRDVNELLTNEYTREFDSFESSHDEYLRLEPQGLPSEWSSESVLLSLLPVVVRRCRRRRRLVIVAPVVVVDASPSWLPWTLRPGSPLLLSSSVDVVRVAQLSQSTVRPWYTTTAVGPASGQPPDDDKPTLAPYRRWVDHDNTTAWQGRSNTTTTTKTKTTLVHDDNDPQRQRLTTTTAYQRPTTTMADDDNGPRRHRRRQRLVVTRNDDIHGHAAKGGKGGAGGGGVGERGQHVPHAPSCIYRVARLEGRCRGRRALMHPPLPHAYGEEWGWGWHDLACPLATRTEQRGQGGRGGADGDREREQRAPHVHPFHANGEERGRGWCVLGCTIPAHTGRHALVHPPSVRMGKGGGGGWRALTYKAAVKEEGEGLGRGDVPLSVAKREREGLGRCALVQMGREGPGREGEGGRGCPHLYPLCANGRHEQGEWEGARERDGRPSCAPFPCKRGDGESAAGHTASLLHKWDGVPLWVVVNAGEADEGGGSRMTFPPPFPPLAFLSLSPPRLPQHRTPGGAHEDQGRTMPTMAQPPGPSLPFPPPHSHRQGVHLGTSPPALPLGRAALYTRNGRRDPHPLPTPFTRKGDVRVQTTPPLHIGPTPAPSLLSTPPHLCRMGACEGKTCGKGTREGTPPPPPLFPVRTGRGTRNMPPPLPNAPAPGPSLSPFGHAAMGQARADLPTSPRRPHPRSSPLVHTTLFAWNGGVRGHATLSATLPHTRGRGGARGHATPSTSLPAALPHTCGKGHEDTPPPLPDAPGPSPFTWKGVHEGMLPWNLLPPWPCRPMRGKGHEGHPIAWPFPSPFNHAALYTREGRARAHDPQPHPSHSRRRGMHEGHNALLPLGHTAPYTWTGGTTRG
ncbi:hypothetical protein EDB89DRAFT_1904738 [Lactarius sanguifluus]|nr:hypothetical protein EDB89DRAFT_1904738 [Lactarius sanguifluus]